MATSNNLKLFSNARYILLKGIKLQKSLKRAGKENIQVLRTQENNAFVSVH